MWKVCGCRFEAHRAGRLLLHGQGVDHAGNISFPASDTTAHGNPTNTENAKPPGKENRQKSFFASMARHG
jgi:hypothetical protein